MDDTEVKKFGRYSELGVASDTDPRYGLRNDEFVNDLPQRMTDSDLVVAMAGYNTCCEILAHAHAALLFPRVTPRVEQLIRAQALEARGLTSTLTEEELEPQKLAQAIDRTLKKGPRIVSERLPQLGGLERLAERIVQRFSAG